MSFLFKGEKNSTKNDTSLFQCVRDLHQTDIVAGLRYPVVVAGLGDQYARALICIRVWGIKVGKDGSW